MNSATNSKPAMAQVINPLLGRIVGGLVIDRHENGEVTISFGGMPVKGKALSLDDILAIEAAGQGSTA